VRKTGIKKDGTKAKYKKAKPKKKSVIKDTGEKIGGSRKDRAARKPKVDKPVVKDDTPAWKKRFIAKEIDANVSVNGSWQTVKRWAVMDAKKGRRGKDGALSGQFLGGRHETKEMAEKAAVMFAAAAVHTIRMNADSKYEIHRILSRGRGKTELAHDQAFDKYSEASDYLLANAEALLARKPQTKLTTGHGEEMLVTPKKVYRKGPVWRKTDAKPEQFVKKFHMRGIEFGNWQGERQTVLNNAFDALSDLADILKVDPSSLFFGKKLGLAFGARGRGGKGGARAHYEPDYVVMNLTKKQGAGSLGHEWWHALDHMIGQEASPAHKETSPTPDGGTVMKVTSPALVMASNILTNSFGGGGIPPEVKTAYRDLMSEIYNSKVVTEVSPEDIKAGVTQAHDNFYSEVKRVRDYISKEMPLAKRFKRAATADQLRTFDEDVHVIARGGPEAGAAERRMKSLVRSLRGKSGEYYVHYLGQTGRSLERAKIKAEELSKSPTQTTTKPTEFFKRSATLDRGRSKPYWTQPHELAARAFSAFLEDKLEAKKRRSDYLSFGSNGDHYAASPANPFPDGAERNTLNEKFDKLLEALKKEGLLKPAKGKTKSTA
jgi:hypothetical protein